MSFNGTSFVGFLVVALLVIIVLYLVGHPVSVK